MKDGAEGIRPRGKDSWQIKYEGPRSEGAKRNPQFVTFRGTLREAKTKRAELIAAAGKGEFVAPSKLTVADHVGSRITFWEDHPDPKKRISARTAERYRELLDNQIA